MCLSFDTAPFLYYKFNPDSTNFYFKVYNKRGGRL